MSEKEFYGRTLARSQALQLLFQAEVGGRTVEDVLGGDYALSQGPLDDYGRELAVGSDSNRDVLDAIIASASRNWSVRRMPAVDRNILRIALFEMLFEDEVPVAVTIDEMVELAKAYGTDESGSFVNGILGRVATDMDAGVDVVSKARADVEARRESAPQADVPEEDDYYDLSDEESDRSDWYGFDDDPDYWEDA